MWLDAADLGSAAAPTLHSLPLLLSCGDCLLPQECLVVVQYVCLSLSFLYISTLLSFSVYFFPYNIFFSFSSFLVVYSLSLHNQPHCSTGTFKEAWRIVAAPSVSLVSLHCSAHAIHHLRREGQYCTITITPPSTHSLLCLCRKES